MTAQLRANCRGTLNPQESVRYGGYVGGDGKMHFTIGYAGNVPGFQIEAVQNAINQWNSVSDTSGIVLEETGGSPDIYIQKNSFMMEGCAAYNPASSSIQYSEANMAWANGGNPALAGRVFAHEIGHALGIDHKSGPSVMVEGSSYMNCLDVATELLSDPTSGDAEDARDCASNAHSDYPFGPPPAYWWEQFNPCYELWFREEYWRCDAEVCWLEYWIDYPWGYCY